MDSNRNTVGAPLSENPARASLWRTLPRAWAMISPYWSSEDRWAGGGLLLVVIGLNLGIVYINVLLNQWNNAFYSALQDKDLAAFRRQLFKVTYLIGIFKALHILHAAPLADEWVRLPNTNRLFSGRSPLAYMLAGGLPAIHTVRRLVDARRGGM